MPPTISIARLKKSSMLAAAFSIFYITDERGLRYPSKRSILTLRALMLRPTEAPGPGVFRGQIKTCRDLL